MTPNFKSLLFFLAFYFSLQPVFSQTPSAKKQELVLEVSTVTSKNYEEVKSALSGMTGITLLAFCEHSNCFLLSYDPTIISSTDDIEKVVQQLHPSYKTKIITNMTVDEMIGNCTQYPASTTPTMSR